MVILKDGVRYNLWTPKHEVNDFEPMIIHHVKDIFGPGCEYFPKQKLKTLANNRSIPDGFVVDFDNKKWYIVELKLRCDDAIRRITGQIVDYKNALKNQKTVRNIYKSIKSIKDANFLDDLINDEKPKIVVLINSLEGELGRQFNEKVEGIESGAEIIEFKTFYREGADPKKVHIHLFEPLHIPKKSVKMIYTKETVTSVTNPDKVEVILNRPRITGNIPTWRKYNIIRIPNLKLNRQFFPGYKTDFILETDIGNIITRVTGRNSNQSDQLGDPNSGTYIQGNLKIWYDNHPELESGDKIIITPIESHKKYKLTFSR